MKDLIREVVFACAGMNVSQARDVLELFDAANDPFLFSVQDADTITELTWKIPSERCSNILVDFCGGPPGFENYYNTSLTIMVADYILTAIVRYSGENLSELFNNLNIIGIYIESPYLGV